MSRSYHLGLDVAGAIRNRHFGGFHDDQGRPFSKRRAEKELQYLLVKGVKMIPLCDPCDCPNFDNETGCPGHESREGEGTPRGT